MTKEKLNTTNKKEQISTLKNLGFGAKPQKKTIYIRFKEKRIPTIQCRWGLINPNRKQIHEHNKRTRIMDRLLSVPYNQKPINLIRKFKNYEMATY
jgi:hypothetical protein